ncbi:MAG: type II toxin-antitoxin system ParD family antitoxin [Candidatus Tectomicrobia bacterium]|nr:type II toxin-antitoxin system ParD family antitoxin [Candidatus Tectomicrobia bacterium]
MNLNGLPTDLAEFVQQELQHGNYSSADEIVCAALRLLQEWEQELDRLAEDLSPAVQDYPDGDRGAQLDTDAIKAEGRKRLVQADI